MRLPVPRSVYDDLQTRYDQLLEKYHALKLAGAVTPAKPATAVQPEPSPEERARRQAEEDYTQNVVRHLMTQGASELEARVIAADLRRAAMDLSPVPFDG